MSGSENAPGAGGKGTAGYWGVSDNEEREKAFEARYRQLIPVGVYQTKAHNFLGCKVCTKDRQVIYYCGKRGLGFGVLPVIKTREGQYRVERCGVCGDIITGKQGLVKRKIRKREKPLKA